MRISVNCCWQKTCPQQNKRFRLWGKLSLSYFCRISHPCPGIRDSWPRRVAGVEVLPEHPKPLKGHHFLVEGIRCCSCSKPAGAQGFPRGTRAGYTHPGADPHLHTVEGAGARVCLWKNNNLKKKILNPKTRSLDQVTESLLETSGCFNDPSVLF